MQHSPSSSAEIYRELLLEAASKGKDITQERLWAIRAEVARRLNEKQQQLFVQAIREDEDLDEATERIKSDTRQEWIDLTKPTV